MTESMINTPANMLAKRPGCITRCSGDNLTAVTSSSVEMKAAGIETAIFKTRTRQIAFRIAIEHK